MRLLHVQRAGGISGSERHLLALLPELARSGHEVQAVVLEVPGGDAFTEALGQVGVPATGIAVEGTLPVRAMVGLERAIRRFRPDILHTHLIHADVHGMLATLGRGPRHVSTIHSTNAHYVRPLPQFGAALAGRSARAVIAISDHVARFVVAHHLAPADRVVRIHYGIDLDSWQPADRADARAALGWAPDQTTAVIASRLVPDKGHDVAIRAVAELARRSVDLELVVAGDGPLRGELEALAGRLGVTDRVRFIGYVSDVRTLFAAADIVLFPTGEGFGEGFGLVNLEAMAMGRPVIGTRVASIPEIVEDGVTGLLVPPDDDKGLADALADLAAHGERRSRFGLAGRRRAEDHFALGTMVDATNAVYERVAAPR